MCGIYILWEEEMDMISSERMVSAGSWDGDLARDVYLSTFCSSKEVKRLKRRFSMYLGSLRLLPIILFGKLDAIDGVQFVLTA
jgi:hypothetical protein